MKTGVTTTNDWPGDYKHSPNSDSKTTQTATPDVHRELLAKKAVQNLVLGSDYLLVRRKT